MWEGRPAELTAERPAKGRVRDSSNDPALGIQTKIVGAEEHAVRVGPEVGCESVRAEVLVEDSADGREIDLQPEAETEFLAELARAQTRVILTGLYRWPDGKECDASILWISTRR
jgi:alpha-ketoglutarate-dependent taurine dioxygenase